MSHFDLANVMFATPPDWFVGDNALSLNDNGDLVLTNVSNLAQAVPEPHSIAIWTLLGLALAGYGYVRSRRRAS